MQTEGIEWFVWLMMVAGRATLKRERERELCRVPIKETTRFMEMERGRGDGGGFNGSCTESRFMFCVGFFFTGRISRE